VVGSTRVVESTLRGRRPRVQAAPEPSRQFTGSL